MSLGVTATSTPHSWKTAILAAAVSSVPADDGAGVAHAAAGRSGGAGDEARDGFFAVGLDPARGLDFGGAPDFADHDDALGLGSSLNILMTSRCDVPLTGSPPMPTQSGLAEALAGDLPDGLVRERAGAGDDANVPFFVNVAGRDADATAAGGILAGAGCDDAGAVGTKRAGLPALHGALHADHILDRECPR